jgi:hypothetical protein
MDPIIGAEDPEDPLGVDVGAVVTDVGPSVGARVGAGDGKQPLHFTCSPACFAATTAFASALAEVVAVIGGVS